jgi:predicted  nucleic acid-binding Zn-ribbon protein
MSIGFNTIKVDLLGKNFCEVQTIIKGLEADERILLQQIFDDSKPCPTSYSKEQATLLESLHTKIIVKEEASCFSWLINFFRGPWFKALRVALGEFKSSFELATLVTDKLAPSKQATSTAFDPNRPPSPPREIIQRSRQEIPLSRISRIEQPEIFLGSKKEEIENRIGVLKTRMDSLERAIDKNIDNLFQTEPNKALKEVETQFRYLKQDIKSLRELIANKRTQPNIDEEELDELVQTLDQLEKPLVNLEALLGVLRTKIRDREAYNGSVAKFNANSEEVPFHIHDRESYALFIAGIKEELIKNAKEVPILVQQIQTALSSLQAAFPIPECQFELEL